MYKTDSLRGLNMNLMAFLEQMACKAQHEQVLNLSNFDIGNHLLEAVKNNKPEVIKRELAGNSSMADMVRVFQ